VVIGERSGGSRAFWTSKRAECNFQALYSTINGPALTDDIHIEALHDTLSCAVGDGDH
jgi:hypothetical protein